MSASGLGARVASDIAAERQRTRQLRVALAAGIAISLIVAAVAFATAIIQNRVLATEVQNEVTAHCRTDAKQDNDRRKLDLALIAANVAYLRQLRIELAAPSDRTDRPILLAQARWLEATTAARIKNVPPYRLISQCG